MNVHGSIELAPSVAELRAVLGDPQRLALALPHVDDFGWDEEPGGAAFSATLRPALALGELPFRTSWRRVTAEPDLLRYHVEGRTEEHWLGMDVSLSLRPRGDGSIATWDIQCRFTGTMRAAGQRVLPAVVNHQARLVLASAAAQAAASPVREEPHGD